MHTDVDIAPFWSWDRHVAGLKEAKWKIVGSDQIRSDLVNLLSRRMIVR